MVNILSNWRILLTAASGPELSPCSVAQATFPSLLEDFGTCCFKCFQLENVKLTDQHWCLLNWMLFFLQLFCQSSKVVSKWSMQKTSGAIWSSRPIQMAALTTAKHRHTAVRTKKVTHHGQPDPGIEPFHRRDLPTS